SACFNTRPARSWICDCWSRVSLSCDCESWEKATLGKSKMSTANKNLGLSEYGLDFIESRYAKALTAATSVSWVGIASTSRVTVNASRTRPGLQTSRNVPPSRQRAMEIRTSEEIPELSI